MPTITAATITATPDVILLDGRIVLDITPPRWLSPELGPAGDQVIAAVRAVIHLTQLVTGINATHARLELVLAIPLDGVSTTGYELARVQGEARIAVEQAIWALQTSAGDASPPLTDA